MLMKVRWEYEGKQYVITKNTDGNMYLNHCVCDKCNEILDGLSSCDFDKVIAAKKVAKGIVDEQERIFNSSDELRTWHNYCVTSTSKIKYRTFQSSKYSFEEKFSSSGLGSVIEFGLIAVAAIAFLAGILYFIYWIWWFFIGDWAFNGPFADDISAGEVTFETIIFFIAFIVIIEEVVRRIRNGHF